MHAFAEFNTIVTVVRSRFWKWVAQTQPGIIGSGNGDSSVGRKRVEQSRSVRGTPAGKFGRRLEQLASEAGLTTAEFAAKVGVTEDAIRKYFRGTDVPRLDRWPRIARVLGLKNAKDLLPDLRAD